MFILEQLKRVQIADGVYFNTIYDDRFKTNRIAVTMLGELSEETAAANAVVPNILTRSCKAYPTYEQLSRKLDYMYGTTISGMNGQMGDFQAMTIFAVGIDDRYTLDGKSISEETADLLCGIIFEPNAENGEFNQEDFSQEQRQLLDALDGQFNDKRAYSMKNFREIMFKGEKYGINKYGTKETVRALTAKKAFDAYLEMLKKARVEIMCIGSGNTDKVCGMFKERFGKIERMPIETKTLIIPRAEEIKEHTDKLDVAQSKMILGFRADCADPDDKVPQTRLACAILGGTAHSKLFNNVREKLSLCYYCMSAYDAVKGVITIESGVQKENIEKAKNAILNEIEEMKKGNISDEEIESTKMSLVNGYMSSVDSSAGTQLWYLGQMLKGKKRTPQQAADEINAVTKEQVIEAIGKITLDTVYVLTGKEDEE
ncbi:MAG: insulinase family protein [Clostridia bacterium]|nr:insulinase family protein [Clostridia bacterium]